MRPAALGCLAALLLAAPAYAWPNVRLGGFIQPEFEAISHDPATIKLPEYPNGRDTVGFAQFRARVLALGEQTFGDVTFDFRLELEGLPQFSLFDAWIDARGPTRGGGYWRVIAGQHKAPFSRQVLVWDPDLQIIGKAWATELAPAHQLGLSAVVNLPYVPWIQLSAGLYNGWGRNNPEPIDRNLMYVGRLALRPKGALLPHVESGLGEDQLSLAANISYHVKDLGDSDEIQLLVGGDAFVSWNGLSAYGELVWGDTRYAAHPMMMTSNVPFNSLAYNLQAGWAIPFPRWLYHRFEIVGRFQGILRNDTVPLAAPGDPNQARYDFVVGVNYFQLGHSLKAMLNYHHYLLPADPNRNARAAEYDALFLLLSYRLEYAP